MTKLNKFKTIIVPLQKAKKDSSWIKESFGAWSNRTDIKSNKWVENLRKKMSIRGRIVISSETKKLKV